MHLLDLMHALWMFDFYEKSAVLPAVSPPQSGTHAPGAAGLLAALGAGTALATPRYISEVDVKNGKQIIDAVGKLANQLDLRTAKHRLSLFDLALRFSIGKSGRRTLTRTCPKREFGGTLQSFGSTEPSISSSCFRRLFLR